MYLRHQAYTLYYRDVCILIFLHVFAYSMLLRCMLKFKRLACGSDNVTQYNTWTWIGQAIEDFLVVKMLFVLLQLKIFNFFTLTMKLVNSILARSTMFSGC